MKDITPSREILLFFREKLATKRAEKAEEALAKVTSENEALKEIQAYDEKELHRVQNVNADLINTVGDMKVERARLKETIKIAINALLTATPEKQIRDYGKGYDWDYKNWVKRELSKKDVTVNVSETHMQAAFNKLYNIIDGYMGGVFFKEFDLFFVQMKKEGRPAPAGPWGYDWDKLDLLSCNAFWQGIGRIALNDYYDAEVKKNV